MATTNRLYEAVFIVNASLDDAQIESVINRTTEYIGKQGGSVTEVDRWGRKRLAYPIQKKNNGFYVVCEFRSPGDALTKLERFFALEEQILRHLVVEVDLKAKEAKLKRLQAAEAAGGEEAPAAQN